MATPTLVVAGVSARLMAQAAARDGYRVVALDAFGDLDTRRASSTWQPIAQPGSLAIDASLLLDALASRSRERGVLGWVAGAGFDHAPPWLDRAAQRLPLIGTAPEDLRALRDPPAWFALLARCGLAHPPTRFELPGERAGWLVKDLHGSGGWSVRPADRAQRLSDSDYVQRELVHATPISALFVADGSRAVLIGCQRQLVTTVGALRHVYAGVIGPIVLAPRVVAAIEHALALLVPATRVRGLASLDLLYTDDADEPPIRVLELNARPPGSLALYAHWPLMRAHVDACRGELPSAARLREAVAPEAADVGDAMRGLEIVYARRAVRLSSRAAQDLAARDDAHDLPAAGQAFDAGQPIVSLSARGADVGAVRAALARSREALLADLENPE